MGAPEGMGGEWGDDWDSWGGSGKSWGMGGMSGRGYGKRTGEVNRFIIENGIDDSAAEKLRDQSPAVQQAVIARGDCSDARNPSAVVLSRIGQATRGGGGRFSPF